MCGIFADTILMYTSRCASFLLVPGSAEDACHKFFLLASGRWTSLVHLNINLRRFAACLFFLEQLWTWGHRPQAIFLGRFAARKSRPRLRLRAKRRIECFPRLALLLAGGFGLLGLLVLLVVLLAVVAFAHDVFLFVSVGLIDDVYSTAGFIW